MVKWHYIKHIFLLLITFLILSSTTCFVSGIFFETDPTATVPSTWVNKPSVNPNSSFTLSPILHTRLSGGPEYALAFYCNTTQSTNCVLGILFFRFSHQNENDSGIWFKDPRLIWSANRNRTVGVNATFQLRQDGNMVLSDSKGVQIWSSNTRGNLVSSLNMTDSGNLVLFDKNNEPIWQSFDYPTDSLLVGQKISPGQRLTASVSESYWCQGSYFLSFDAQNISAYVVSNPPQRYAYGGIQDLTLVNYYNGSFNHSQIPFSKALAQYMNFGSDGHFRVYEWLDDKMIWNVAMDILHVIGGDCGYPLACGTYGICLKGQCSCPDANNSETASFFKPNNVSKLSLGCSPTNQISCTSIRNHDLIELKETYYFALDSILYHKIVEVEACKRNCLKDCSCRAALYLYNSSNTGGGGGCMFITEVFTITENKFSLVTSANTSLFIRVQNSPSIMKRKSTTKVAAFVSASLGGLIVLVLCVVFLSKSFRKTTDIEGDITGNTVLGMPSKYSYEELKIATKNFSTKLGQGGFGSVYKGILYDGTEIAVKCLDNIGKGKDESFLAEVRSIGSIHHYNLVHLIGFCTEKSHRLLVYEYMINGSLDRWIYGKNQDNSLQWKKRRKIIVDIAKGLAYLHEECSQKIIHLDIKPQNILLDKDMNAKVSDFGLSKLIEKDQSRTVTKMRGTPGYLAPEWLRSTITEKVDVYSFGIVTLEILCGRKNLDRSKPEEDKHLLSLYTEKVKKPDGLWELVDKNCKDIEIHRKEVEEMMKIAAWCLQSDFTKRPSMSLVVKVLEGLLPAETNLDFDLTNLSAFGTVAITPVADGMILSQVFPSLLSAPR